MSVTERRMQADQIRVGSATGGRITSWDCRVCRSGVADQTRKSCWVRGFGPKSAVRAQSLECAEP